jgi:hypothetical protein
LKIDVVETLQRILLRADAFLFRADAFLFRADAFLLRADAFLFRADTFLFRADAFLLRADAFLFRADIKPDASNAPPRFVVTKISRKFVSKIIRIIKYKVIEYKRNIN